MRPTLLWSQAASRHTALDVVQFPNRVVEFAPRRRGVSPTQRAFAAFKLLPYRVKIVLDAYFTHASSQRTGWQQCRRTAP